MGGEIEMKEKNFSKCVVDTRARRNNYREKMAKVTIEESGSKICDGICK